MERCKHIARAAGLKFSDSTLEYIVTNHDMLELSPKIMIPTLYDYWVHDVEAVQNNWIYDSYPTNPYETVINTRPPISYYNQDNADWFNVMIFYHVLGHIDFFQNNLFFRGTWDDDFCGQALADKRLINKIREDLGAEKRWVDYVIEFSRLIDNFVGYYPELEKISKSDSPEVFGVISPKVDFYFGKFLRELYDAQALDPSFYYQELERYNRCIERVGKENGERAFFDDYVLRGKFPEFQAVYKQWLEKEKKTKPSDIFEYLWEYSDVLNKDENKWMKDVMQVVRRTSLYFQAQIRTKICNEGWASLWHQRLFIPDERIRTHEVDFAKVDSRVTTDPQLGINPYAVGMHLFEFIEDLARKGRLSPSYQLLNDMELRKNYDTQPSEEYVRKVLFETIQNVNDERLINFLSDNDFQDFVDRYKLFVVGVRPHPEKPDKAEVYIKSKNGVRYRQLLNDSLYHPPNIDYESESHGAQLYLNHIYEGRSLVTKYIPAVLAGLSFFTGRDVRLETTEYELIPPKNWLETYDSGYKPKHSMKRVLYIYSRQERQIKRQVL
ncbi:MAG: SpoVR family protein [bacterium]|nr:SpoVR family protein [bacterium]